VIGGIIIVERRGMRDVMKNAVWSRQRNRRSDS